MSLKLTTRLLILTPRSLLSLPIFLKMASPPSAPAGGVRTIPGAPQAAIQNSRWALVKTYTFFLFSFVNPVLSGALAATVLAALIAHSGFGLSVPAIILHCAVASVAVSAGIHLYNVANHANSAQLRLPVDKGSVNHLGVR
jgi:hypothetical protein